VSRLVLSLRIFQKDGLVIVLKPYPAKFTEDLLFTTPLHPSTWLYSSLTKNPPSAIVTTVGLILVMFVVTIITSNFFALWMLLMLLAFYFFAIITCVKSYKILKRDYNDHLFAIEETFNRISHMNRLKYSSILKSAYEICENRNLDEYGELKKIRELFELTAPANKILSLDEELALKKKQLKEKQEYDKYIQDIADEFK